MKQSTRAIARFLFFSFLFNTVSIHETHSFVPVVIGTVVSKETIIALSSAAAFLASQYCFNNKNDRSFDSSEYLPTNNHISSNQSIPFVLTTHYP